MKEKWNLDIRVGCVAVYTGELENCLSGMEKSSRTMFYRRGKWDEERKVWNVDPQDIAKARLIASAPDLLEALIMARNFISIACGESAPFVKIALERIDAAIAEAEG